MTQEQKAKAYDEALERMKSWVRGKYPGRFTTVEKVAEFIFPELNEGEDERIRKGIKSILEHYKESGEVVCPYLFVSIDEALTWLDKQSEQKSVYVVTRSEEHSDYVETVFLNEDKAEEYCKLFNKNENFYVRNITKVKIQ